MSVNVAISLLHSAQVAPPPRESGLRLFTHTLRNGLLVVVVENDAVPLATIEVTVRNGSMNEPLALNGLSHLYEHMFFKGNAVIPHQQAYMRKLRQMGALWNGTTSTERVNYFYTLPSRHLAEGMAFMAHAVISPRFETEELRKEREVVL
ncbi:MAG: M16 family metallopeptidase, partial [Candidatus Xenobia bacterium]